MSLNLLRNFRNVTNQWSIKSNQVQRFQIRFTTSFFTRLSASQLWKGITSVSNVGRKRGRQKSLRKRIDLNRGQIVGHGKKSIELPSLNTQNFKGNQISKIRQLGQNENFEKNLLDNRKYIISKKSRKLHPLERGWAGRSLFGRSIGLPEHLKNELKDFDCKVIQQRARPKMIPRIGRIRSVYSLVVCGNRKGLVGFARAFDNDFHKSANLARSKALKRLRYIHLDNNSIMHDFTSSFGHSTLVCFKMPAGFGVVGDRIVKNICSVMGINDLYVNVIRGAHHRYNVLCAFIFGLTQQKTYQQIADEKGLNIVEFKEENDFLPRIVAKPSNGKTRIRSDIDPLEIMDFRQYLLGGRVYDTSNLDKSEAPWLNAMNYARYLQIHHRHRHRLPSRVQLRKRFGKVESFLTLREKEKRIKKFGQIPDPPKIEYK